MYRKLGATLENRGKWFLKNAFKVNYRIVSKEHIKHAILNATGKTPYLADRKYYLTDWETCLQLLKYDWVDKKKYLTDRYDCDNFSDSLAARMAEIYDLNNFGRLTCNGKKLKTGETFGHRASIAVDSDLNVYAIEPQTDEYVKIKRGKPIILEKLNWELTPTYIELN